ncbi:helix-turn-helix transcriptional regulator [Dactylosporangium sp. NPDC000555]|uniref:PadR family transcriptional regulator n=1 Tax=Dactylosporangium sp. NPDC000555 TaxID=3154260 RepID=UPI00331D7264
MDGLRMTTAVVKVVAALLADPTADRYGLELMRTTGLPSGTLYPVLERLQRAGWVEAYWEQLDPAAAGRPARRYYRLTADGTAAARSELAALHQQLGRAQQPSAQPRLT